MREEIESITFTEEGFYSMSRYSKDGRFAYSLPKDTGIYTLRNGCDSLELKGEKSMIHELVLPDGFHFFHLESIRCLPFLRKITAYCDFDFVLGNTYYSYVSDIAKYWYDTQIEELVVLPWLVEKYKKIFGYSAGFSEAIIKVTPIPDDIAFKFVNRKSEGYVTSKNGRIIVKVDNHVKVLEIPIEVERIAATAFDKDNIIEKVIILGDSEDSDKNRSSVDFDKNAVNALAHVETLVFQGPMYTHFYNDIIKDAKIPKLRTIIYPLWNYNHYCFRGAESESVINSNYEIKAENFSSVELVENDGIVYTKDGKFLVSGVDCKSKIVHIKDGVEEIFQYAFCCNLSIEEVYIPRSVRKVGKCAFKSCKNIKKIVFNFYKITNDAESAFFTYSSCIQFYLPESNFSSVIKYQYERLHKRFSKDGLGALTEKCVKTDSPMICVHTLPFFSGNVIIDEETGYVFNENEDTFVGVLKEKAKDIKRIKLPCHIKKVSENAFDSMNSIEEIVVSEEISVKELYDYVKSISTIKTISSRENSLIIEDGIAYYNNYKEIVSVSKSVKVKHFVCKEGVEVILPSAFEGHRELEEIKLPQTIKNISDRAFANTGISKIIFPASLSKIGREVFANCKLMSVVFEGQIGEGYDAFDSVDFISTFYVKVQKKYKTIFIDKYPELRKYVRTPLPKWLSWLE